MSIAITIRHRHHDDLSARQRCFEFAHRRQLGLCAPEGAAEREPWTHVRATQPLVGAPGGSARPCSARLGVGSIPAASAIRRLERRRRARLDQDAQLLACLRPNLGCDAAFWHHRRLHGVRSCGVPVFCRVRARPANSRTAHSLATECSFTRRQRAISGKSRGPGDLLTPNQTSTCHRMTTPSACN
jgi:hypothetical protein